VDRKCYDLAIEGTQFCKKHSHSNGELTLYYWPAVARVGAALRMLHESKTPFTWKTEFDDFKAVSSGWGAPTTTYAPPILKDGESLISQSLAIAVHVGRRCGYDKGIPCSSKALQFMGDAYDFWEEATKHSKDLAGLNAFLKAPPGEGKIAWCDEWLNNFENSIQGPFYYGEQVTYVDFWTTQTFDWVDFLLFKPLTVCLAKYPKLSGMLAGTRALGAGGFQDKPIAPATYAVCEQLAADFKK